MTFKKNGYLWASWFPFKFVAMANLLKDFPTEVKKAVLIKQAEIKSEKTDPTKFNSSQRIALIQIVKEWIELKRIKSK